MFELVSCFCLLSISSTFTALHQVCFGIITHRSAPQQLDVPDGDNGGFAEGSDAAEQQHSAQTAATTNRVRRGEAADQLDVHLPLWLPTGQLLLCLF